MVRNNCKYFLLRTLHISYTEDHEVDMPVNACKACHIGQLIDAGEWSNAQSCSTPQNAERAALKQATQPQIQARRKATFEVMRESEKHRQHYITSLPEAPIY